MKKFIEEKHDLLAGIVKAFPNGANYGIRVDFKRTLSSNDIDELISLIDYAVLLFVARNKS